ncbi:Fe-S cluster assembly protein SufB [Klenkia terrae]
MLTDAGRSGFPHAYDDLALTALRFVAAHGGPDAVRDVAEQQLAGLEQRCSTAVERAAATTGPEPVDRAQVLAEALTAEGYAASASAISSGGQLCQHHCPVAHVAAEFPQLCEAETAVIGRLVGTHVQRLATIAHGDGICTTHIPGTPGAGTQPAPGALYRTSGRTRAAPHRATPDRTPGRGHPHDHHRAAGHPLTQDEQIDQLGRYKYGWADADVAGASSRRGIDEEVVRDISRRKNEPEWMLERRLKALKLFGKKPMPDWGSDLSGIDFDNIKYFVRSTEKQAATWDDLPADIKNTYDKLGIPEAEKQRLVSGVAAQYESEVVYHSIREDLEEQGVLFLDTDTALREHEDLFREYFGSVIPSGDNKFSALNTAVWSGGSFIYVPPGVNVEIPLQAYFRINTENMGQFERTLIVVDEGAYVHYVEGCTAPIYKSDSLHSAVVEIIVKKNARCRYTTIQNWSNNVYNLVTKRAVAHEGATMEWVDGNIGSKVTMKYPAVWMTGEHAKGEVLSIAFAGEGQHQDAGAKMVHAAPHTSSNIISKSVARGGGRTSYRGLVQIDEGAHGSRSTVKCDALLVDTISRSDTYPYVDVREDDVSMGHEATVSRVSEDQLFYLMSRGLSEDEAMAMVVRGFVEPIARELPMEYALELNRLIELQMEGAVG